jgi:hypothetical protein
MLVPNTSNDINLQTMKSTLTLFTKNQRLSAKTGGMTCLCPNIHSSMACSNAWRRSLNSKLLEKSESSHYIYTSFSSKTLWNCETIAVK